MLGEEVKDFSDEELRKFNCHFFTWMTSEKNPLELGKINFLNKYSQIMEEKIECGNGLTKGQLEIPIIDGYRQLKPDEPNQPGDRFISYYDFNGSGAYEPEEDGARHSGIVLEVSKRGYTKKNT